MVQFKIKLGTIVCIFCAKKTPFTRNCYQAASRADGIIVDVRTAIAEVLTGLGARFSGAVDGDLDGLAVGSDLEGRRADHYGQREALSCTTKNKHL